MMNRKHKTDKLSRTIINCCVFEDNTAAVFQLS